MNDTEQTKEFLKDLLSPEEPEKYREPSLFEDLWIFISVFIGIGFAIYLYFKFWIFIASLIL